MNGVIGMTNLLLNTPLSTEQQRYATIVRDSAHSLLAILNDVLDLSKLDAGKLALEIVDVDLRALVENTTDLLLGRAHEQQTAVLVWIDPRISPMLRGDPVRLRQVLLNLLSNAIKFTREGEVVVKVTAEETSDAAPMLRCSVSDTGIGISEQARKRLFQPFAQADDSTTRQYGGTGLGLAIAKRLIDAMGGEIGVDSVEGHGSTFWFTIPMPAAATTASNDVDLELRCLRALATLRGRRVLLADDRPSSVEIIQKYMNVWGITCDVAASGVAALAALRKSGMSDNPYVVVIVDEDLKDMDCSVIAGALEQHQALAGTRRVLLASWNQEHTGGSSQRAGFATVVPKPIKQLSLLAALTNQQPTINVQPARVEATFALADPVLVVEDNDVNLEVVQAQLRQLGIKTYAARNGREAVDAVAQRRRDGLRPFPLVLMDCHMPEMDGYTATAAIRKNETDGSHLPIIALTASAMQGDRELCLRSGMDDYLSKPVELDNLHTMLARWLPDLPATRSQQPQQGSGVIAMPANAPAPVGPLDRRQLENLRRMTTADDPAFLERLIASFRDNAPECFRAIETAVAANDAEMLRQAAHKLKGSAANFGARGLAARCLELEQLGRSGQIAGASDGLAHARAEYERVIEALKHEALIPLVECAA